MSGVRRSTPLVDLRSALGIDVDLLLPEVGRTVLRPSPRAEERLIVEVLMRVEVGVGDRGVPAVELRHEALLVLARNLVVPVRRELRDAAALQRGKADYVLLLRERCAADRDQDVTIVGQVERI